MKRLNRRAFVTSTASAAAFSFTNLQTPASSFQATSQYKKPNHTTVHFTGDGLGMSSVDYSRLLTQLADAGNAKADSYSLSGCIEELEIKFARLLGKERAVFMPTGTLANHLAIRTLAGNRGRALVQSESHIYNDCGDCLQILSNINLIPLASNRATFTLHEVEAAIEKGSTGRVATKIGVISIESPVRRKQGEMFDFNEMRRIAEFAQKQDIRLHLDGARLFIASAYSGIAPAEYASLFDTVYVSLYKSFNAASGAILAGTKDVLDSMFHTRRMFGAGLPEAWPYAAVALHYADGFIERFKRAVQTSEFLIQELSANAEFQIERIPLGTNIFKLRIPNIENSIFRASLEKRGIFVRESGKNTNDFTLTVNETLNRMPPLEMAKIFIEARKLSA